MKSPAELIDKKTRYDEIVLATENLIEAVRKHPKESPIEVGHPAHNLFKYLEACYGPKPGARQDRLPMNVSAPFWCFCNMTRDEKGKCPRIKRELNRCKKYGFRASSLLRHLPKDIKPGQYKRIRKLLVERLVQFGSDEWAIRGMLDRNQSDIESDIFQARGTPPLNQNESELANV